MIFRIQPFTTMQRKHSSLSTLYPCDGREKGEACRGEKVLREGKSLLGSIELCTSEVRRAATRERRRKRSDVSSLLKVRNRAERRLTKTPPSKARLAIPAASALAACMTEKETT